MSDDMPIGEVPGDIESVRKAYTPQRTSSLAGLATLVAFANLDAEVQR